MVNGTALHCYANCVANYFTGIDTYDATILRCAASCADFASPVHTYQQTCPSSCPEESPYFDSAKKCTADCGATAQTFFPNATSGECLESCPAGIYVVNTTAKHCWASCNQKSGIDTSFDASQKRCVDACSTITGA